MAGGAIAGSGGDWGALLGAIRGLIGTQGESISYSVQASQADLTCPQNPSGSEYDLGVRKGRFQPECVHAARKGFLKSSAKADHFWNQPLAGFPIVG
jgi:hypothetical protein